MTTRLPSFAYVLPLIELLFAVLIVLVPALLEYSHFKNVAHGSGGVLLGSGDYVLTIPSESFLTVAFDRAEWRAEKKITILNAPAKFIETAVSLVVARKAYWWPSSLLEPTWRDIMYPIYALPAWFFVGFGTDGVVGRRRIHRWGMIVSVVLSLTCALLLCGFRFGISEAEREGQQRLDWFIDGLATWSVLFLAPAAAWILQRKRVTLVNDKPLAE